MKVIKNHINHLKKEHGVMIDTMALYPLNSFGRDRLNLAIKLWDLKIVLWECFI